MGGKKSAGIWQPDFDAAERYWTADDKKSSIMPEDELIMCIEEFIGEHNTCALATGTGDFVRCTPVEYDYMDGAFYMLSEGGLKFHALRDNRNVCLAIFDPFVGFGSLGGMQVTGRAEFPEPFCEEYDSLLEHKGMSPEAMQMQGIALNMIKVVPSEIDYLDSKLKNKGYDTRQHISFDAGHDEVPGASGPEISTDESPDSIENTDDDMYSVSDIFSAMLSYQNDEEEQQIGEDDDVPDEYAGDVFCDKYGKSIDPYN